MCYQLTSEGLTEALVKLPLLEDLEVSHCSLSGDYLKLVGQSCPYLKTCVGNANTGGSKMRTSPYHLPQLNKAISFSAIKEMKKRSPSVIVIRAGISAAPTPQDDSFQVVLFESRDKIGGRVNTDYSFGFPVVGG